jgi:fructokinase
MHQSQLLPMIRRRVQELLNGYLHVPLILERIEDYIVSPGLGDRAGILGALALAQQASERSQDQSEERRGISRGSMR